MHSEANYVSLCPVVPMSVPMSRANIGIFVSLRANSERILMKILGGDHYHQQTN